ncbi:hypothetical protein Tco_0348549 [Tanacetum coccineum]
MVIDSPYYSVYEELASPEQTATDWKLLFLGVAASFDYAVHRVHAVSFDAIVASTVSAACWFYDAAAYFVVFAGSSRSVPADYVPAGHVIISADRYREYADLIYKTSMCKISVQSKRVTSNNCEKNTQVPERKSTSGACQILSGKLVCWSVKKQQSVAMSSTEAKYVAAAGCCVSILWMKSQLSDYDIHYKMVPIFCDNTSAIAISNNPILYSRTKHIDIRYHFIRDHILKGDIELHFIPTEYQLTDIFTKPLDE